MLSQAPSQYRWEGALYLLVGAHGGSDKPASADRQSGLRLSPARGQLSSSAHVYRIASEQSGKRPTGILIRKNMFSIDELCRIYPSASGRGREVHHLAPERRREGGRMIAASQSAFFTVNYVLTWGPLNTMVWRHNVQ